MVFQWTYSVGVPHNEVRVGLLHDEFLWTNVLLLSSVDNVPLLQDLHGKGFVLITLELNLQRERKEKRCLKKVSPYINLHSLLDNCKKVKKKNHSCYCHSAVCPTSSTRPKPPTPRVSMMLKSARLRLKKNAFSASYLWCREEGGKEDRMGTGLEMRWRMKEEIIHFQQPESKYPLICLQILED